MDAFITGDIEEIRVGKVEIVICNSSGKIVFKAVCHRETVETAGDKRVEIVAPEGLVVIPGLIFQLTAEVTADAADLIRGRLFDRLGQMQGNFGIGAKLHTLCQFEQSIDIASWVDARDEDGRRTFKVARSKTRAFSLHASFCMRKVLCHVGSGSSHNDARSGALCFTGGLRHAAINALGGERLAQLFCGSFYGRARRDGIAAVDEDGYSSTGSGES